MKFPYLSELGHHYSAEEGTRGVRVGALTGLETGLKKAIIDLKNLTKNPGAPAPAPVPTGNRVKDLAALHEWEQKKANPGSALTAARAKVDRIKKWLTLQGVQVKADGSIDWPQDTHVVEYDKNLATQGLTMLRFNSGRVFLDDSFTRPLDTGKMVTHFSGPGHAIFVMSKNGNIHVDSHAVGYRHHSSLLGGKKVAGAGELKVQNGWIEWLSNKSGHYAPSITHMVQVLHILQKKGVPMTFRLSALSRAGKKDYPTVTAFLTEIEADGEPDYDLMKLFAYSAHLTDAVLNPNGWRWRIPSEEPGVHVIATGQLVPHKTVRQWLKAQGLFATKEVQSGAAR